MTGNKIDGNMISPPGILSRLFREYCHALVDTGISKSRKDLKKADLIDVRPLLPKIASPHELPPVRRTPEEIEYIKGNYWYANVPCFETGTLQLNADRYFWFKILEIKPEEDRYTVLVEDYQYTKENGWEPGCSVAATYCFPPLAEDSGTCNVVTTYSYAMDYVTLYQLLDRQQLGWTQREYDEWRRIIAGTKQRSADIIRTTGNDLHELLAAAFINVIPRINYHLSLHKPKLKPGQRTNAIRTAIAEGTDEPVRRRTRIVGTLSIRSEKPPRPPRRETIVRYKTAAWKTRGHIRTYKSGKKVWIRESVHRRKCLREQDVPQTVIKFRDPAGRQERPGPKRKEEDHD